MKEFFSNFFLSAALMLTAVSATAQDENKIQGYFRVQNVGNGNYVEVTGPFTAKPNLPYTEAEHSAGTVMYVEAVQAGDSYRLTHLRCQGIDVAMDAIDANDYYQTLLDAVASGESPVYGLVRGGFKYGYTSIARATVGTVFLFVAGALEDYTPDNDYEDRWAYFDVAEDFNREVVSKLDLGIRMKPVEDKERTVQVYFDVPSLEPVCEWYNGDPESDRHKTFYSAMLAMTKYLAKKEINLETFLPEDITLFKKWNYYIEEAYPENIEDGKVVLTFDKIFSDPILLFNWIKMVGYYILNPKNDPHNLTNLGFGDLGSSAQNHYLTKLLIDYLPRIHHNSRAYLINGRVGDYDTAGGSWDAAGNTLGFASELEMFTAGENGQWTLQPIDNDKQKFVVRHKHTGVTRTGENGQSDLTFGTSALYFDFPVEVKDESTELYTLGSNLCTTIFGDYTYVYNRVKELEGPIYRLTPFLVKTSGKDEVQMLVCNDGWFYKPLDPEATAPENSLVIGDEEVAKQYSLARPLYLSDNEDTSLRGVLLPTSLQNNDLANLWGGDTNDIYSYNAVEGIEDVNGSDKQHVGFNEDPRDLDANEAVYVPSANNSYVEWVEPDEALEQLKNNSFVYIGDPVLASLSGVIVPEMEEGDNILYDLRGIRVSKPVPGNIYILNGKKILVK